MSSITVKPGPRDQITDVPGIRVGQAEDAAVRTGVTVILPEKPVVMAADIRGGAPGTRETDALDPTCLVDQFHGLVLAGGSVFGLGAADAVVDWLSAKGVGLALGPRAIPVVPAAILYDLANGGEKDWGEASPYRKLAIEACEACEVASETFREGAAGAGFGAIAGDVPGGIGSASSIIEGGQHEGLIVGVIVAVNSFGSVETEDRDLSTIHFPKMGAMAGNTTIAAVATNLALGKAGAERVSIMAHDGLARAIRPLHTPFDGDSVFTLATGEMPVSDVDRSILIATAGAMAADCLTRAVRKAIDTAAKN